MAAPTPASANSAISFLSHRPSFVNFKNYRFLIMDAPSDVNLPAYIEECQKHNVSHVVRACEPTYGIQPLQKAGIQVHEMPFPDGDPPPNNVIDPWLDLCQASFAKDDKSTIAVHCVAGLGRAPVLVVLALVELGMEPMDAVDLVRKKRRGAINAKQLKWLQSYKPRRGDKKCRLM
jgi:protein tyrosine phosphatase type 4A